MERKTTIGANGLGQFFVMIYCADGSCCQDGPYADYDSAQRAEDVLLSGKQIDSADWSHLWEVEQAITLWAEQGGYAAGLPRCSAVYGAV